MKKDQRDKSRLNSSKYPEHPEHPEYPEKIAMICKIGSKPLFYKVCLVFWRRASTHQYGKSTNTE
ncbi:MAG: hypothetical protein J5743_02675 [Victivallales bacterium]|nr:hypothetical protein [Victivallales bacterium]